MGRKINKINKDVLINMEDREIVVFDKDIEGVEEVVVIDKGKSILVEHSPPHASAMEVSSGDRSEGKPREVVMGVMVVEEVRGVLNDVVVSGSEPKCFVEGTWDTVAVEEAVDMEGGKEDVNDCMEEGLLWSNIFEILSEEENVVETDASKDYCSNLGTYSLCEANATELKNVQVRKSRRTKAHSLKLNLSLTT